MVLHKQIRKPSPRSRYYGYHARPERVRKSTPAIAFKIVKACICTDNSDLVSLVCDRLPSTEGLQPDDVQLRTTNVLIPLIPKIDELRASMSIDATRIPGIQELCSKSVEQYITSMQTSKLVPTTEHMSAIVRAVALSRNSAILENM